MDTAAVPKLTNLYRLQEIEQRPADVVEAAEVGAFEVRGGESTIDVSRAQREDAQLGPIIEYIEDGRLPEEDSRAQPVPSAAVAVADEGLI